MNMNFAIGIPTINRADLLTPTLEKYFKDFPNTYFVIIDNGCQDIPANRHTTIFRNGRNLGVSASWNVMARYVFYKLEIPNIIILNDDVYWGKTEKEVNEFIDQNRSQDFIVSEKEWCNFLLSQDTYEIVGEFDEDIMCYHEDNDYYYRMKRLNLSVISSPFLFPLVFQRSMSIKKDPALKQFYQISRAYFKRKWGGEPGQEIFRTPFGLDE